MAPLVTVQRSPSSSSPRLGFSKFSSSRKAVYLMVRFLSCDSTRGWRLEGGVPVNPGVVKGSLLASRDINVVFDAKPEGVGEEYWLKLLVMLRFYANVYPPVDDPVEYMLAVYPGVPREDVERAWSALRVAGLVG